MLNKWLATAANGGGYGVYNGARLSSALSHIDDSHESTCG